MSNVDETSVSNVDETVRVDRLKEANLFVDIKKRSAEHRPAKFEPQHIHTFSFLKIFFFFHGENHEGDGTP